MDTLDPQNLTEAVDEETVEDEEDEKLRRPSGSLRLEEVCEEEECRTRKRRPPEENDFSVHGPSKGLRDAIAKRWQECGKRDDDVTRLKACKTMYKEYHGAAEHQDCSEALAPMHNFMLEAEREYDVRRQDFEEQEDRTIAR